MWHRPPDLQLVLPLLVPPLPVQHPHRPPQAIRLQLRRLNRMRVQRPPRLPPAIKRLPHRHNHRPGMQPATRHNPRQQHLTRSSPSDGKPFLPTQLVLLVVKKKGTYRVNQLELPAGAKTDENWT